MNKFTPAPDLFAACKQAVDSLAIISNSYQGQILEKTLMQLTKALTRAEGKEGGE